MSSPDEVRPSVEGFGQTLSPLHKWFISQLAEPPKPGHDDEPANEYARSEA